MATTFMVSVQNSINTTILDPSCQNYFQAT